MKITRFLLRTFDRVLSPLLLTLIFWAIISGYQLPTVSKLDFSRFFSRRDTPLPETTNTIPYANLGAIYKESQTTQANLHGLAGWEGVDISGGCGATIYSPINGRVTYNGLDGYVGPHASAGEENTMLTITGDGVEVTLLHGDYVPAVGEKISVGGAVGKENEHGNATGCHSHVILRVNGRTVNYLTWLQEEASKRRVVDRGEGAADYGLRLSHYWPANGGTNCDEVYDAFGNLLSGDCNTMARGEKVADWIGGRNGVYAAACANELERGWAIRGDGQPGTRFQVSGVQFECTDTGGWIRCLEPGDHDPAIANAHSKGHLMDQPVIAEEPYCWVDMLIQTPLAPYGTITFDWSK